VPVRRRLPLAASFRSRRSSAPGAERDGGGLLMAMVLVAAAYFVPRGISWNADTHLFLTASLVDRGALNIDPLAAFTGDVAAAHGHFYADKAPGLSLLATPVYLLLKYTLLGGHPFTSLYAVPEEQSIDFLVRYLLALVYAGVPTAIVAVLLYRFLPRLGLSVHWSAAVALAFGLATPARAFAGEFFSHQLAAALLFGAFVLLYRLRQGELDARWAAVAGLLLGTAIITEYPTALIALALGIYALMAPDIGRRLALFAGLGAVPPLLVGALYNALAFGGPLSTGYSHLAGSEVFRTGQAQGFLGITLPHLDGLWQTTFGPYRGLFLLAPVLLLAVPGFAVLQRMARWRAEARLSLAIVVAYGLFTVSYFAWDGGYSLGPRDFLPALPFLMLPIGALLVPSADARWRWAFGALAVCSALVINLATAVGPLVAPSYSSPLTQWVLPQMAAGQLDNNWGMLFRLPGLLQLLPLVLALGGLGLLYWRRTGGHATLAAKAASGA
jgi:hypothetical protein